MWFMMFLMLAAPQQRCSLPAYDEVRDQRPVQASGHGLWVGGVAFVASDFASMEPVFDEIAETWRLRVRFTPAGLSKFIRAQSCGVGNMIEISIDREVISRPRLNEPVVELTIMKMGLNSRADAEALAAWIRQRSIP
jgi:hypothetical protein